MKILGKFKQGVLQGSVTKKVTLIPPPQTQSGKKSEDKSEKSHPEGNTFRGRPSVGGKSLGSYPGLSG